MVDDPTTAAPISDEELEAAKAAYALGDHLHPWSLASETLRAGYLDAISIARNPRVAALEGALKRIGEAAAPIDFENVAQTLDEEGSYYVARFLRDLGSAIIANDARSLCSCATCCRKYGPAALTDRPVGEPTNGT